MEMTTKAKLITLYIVIGMVWCILGLPNLLATAGNSAWKATVIALARITGWPIFVGLVAKKYLKSEDKSDDGKEDSD